MFRDTSEELARLEAELLKEEEPEAEALLEEKEEDPWLYEDTMPEEEDVVFQNYSNDYGKNLRNYASGYRAYNTDETDEDLDSYSEEVHRGKRSGGCLTVVLCLLVLALAAGAIVWIAYQRGYL